MPHPTLDREIEADCSEFIHKHSHSSFINPLAYSDGVFENLFPLSSRENNSITSTSWTSLAKISTVKNYLSKSAKAVSHILNAQSGNLDLSVCLSEVSHARRRPNVLMKCLPLNYVVGQYHLLIGGTLIRWDSYLYGHPYPDKFRSVAQWLPHLEWLASFQFDETNPYNFNDYVNCKCVLCKKLRQANLDIFREMTAVRFTDKRISELCRERRFSVPFRVCEVVWVYVKVYFKNRIVEPLTMPFFDAAWIPAFGEVDAFNSGFWNMGSNSAETENLCRCYWPAIIIKRSNGFYATTVGYSMESVEKQLDMVTQYPDITYTIKLINRPEFMNVSGSSIVPYTRTKPELQFPLWVFQTGTHAEISWDLQKAVEIVNGFESSIALIKDPSSNGQQKINLVWFGVEMMRPGDFIRILIPSGKYFPDSSERYKQGIRIFDIPTPSPMVEYIMQIVRIVTSAPESQRGELPAIDIANLHVIGKVFKRLPPQFGFTLENHPYTAIVPVAILPTITIPFKYVIGRYHMYRVRENLVRDDSMSRFWVHPGAGQLGVEQGRLNSAGMKVVEVDAKLTEIGVHGTMDSRKFATDDDILDQSVGSSWSETIEHARNYMDEESEEFTSLTTSQYYMQNQQPSFTPYAYMDLNFYYSTNMEQHGQYFSSGEQIESYGRLPEYAMFTNYFAQKFSREGEYLVPFI
ncbi:hypothetical protein HK098_002251 [Nowakowskiella sp. JEL0407]|nr:hypothetical protein HK098_002251 [Nowakowskiella sp. JEL0407]